MLRVMPPLRVAFILVNPDSDGYRVAERFETLSTYRQLKAGGDLLLLVSIVPVINESTQ